MARPKPNSELTPSARRNKRWREAHPEQSRLIGHSAYERTRDSRLRSTFGITLAEYDRMLGEQNGVCYLCGRPETATRNGKIRRLNVDHNHVTGKVRHLLCSACNMMIGMSGENPLVLEKAAAMLRSENG